MKVDFSAANALIGLSVVEVFNVYKDVAPSLKECRMAPPGDYMTSQGLLDAEVMGGIAAVLLGGAAAILTQGMGPLLLSGLGLLLITQYYRSVLRSPSPLGDPTNE